MICKLDSTIGDLEIDYFKKTDIDAQLDYLYNSPKEFLEGIGFDLLKLPGRENIVLWL